MRCMLFFFFNDTATTEIYTLSLHDALPICMSGELVVGGSTIPGEYVLPALIGRFKGKYPDISICLLIGSSRQVRSEEHTSELQSRLHLVCRLLLEKKKRQPTILMDPDQHQT